MDVILVRVVSLRPVVVGLEPAVAAQALSGAELEAEVREAGEYLAQRAETFSDARISARYQVIEATEPVARVILETAKREHADVIALGTHAKAGVSRLVLGSVSEEILEHSPMPVLLVRQKRGPWEFIAHRFGSKLASTGGSVPNGPHGEIVALGVAGRSRRSASAAGHG
jgi:nucleotide-binding universal stress UspA family protein